MNRSCTADAPHPRTVVDETSNLTASQTQVWIAQKLLPKSSIYNVATAVKLVGNIDGTHFKSAFHTLINSSDALRSVIEERNGIPIRRVLPEVPEAVTLLDFSATGEPSATANEWINCKCKSPFDLEKQLFDSALIKTSSTEYLWYFAIHHIVSDAWSVQLVCEAMSRFYELALKGELPSRMNLPPYDDYVAHEREAKDSARRKKTESYWVNKLQFPVEPLRFHGRPIVRKGTEILRISCDLGYERSQQLRKALQQTGCAGLSSDAAALNAFCAVLYVYLKRFHGNERFFIGLVSHNRRQKRFKQTIGLFSEVLPIRIESIDTDSFASLLKIINSEITETVRHGNFALSNPVNKPLYDVVLNYHRASWNKFCDIPAVPQWVHPGEGFESLTLQVHDFVCSGKFVIDFDFHTDVFTREQAERAVAHFLTVFDLFVTAPNAPLNQMRILSPVEEKQQLSEWNRTEKLYPDASPVTQLFEQQVCRTPEAPAVVLEGKALSYAQLNSRTNRLARHLIGLGVGAEKLVGVYLERSFNMVVAWLATLKAGGAFLPVDPSWPADRTALILQDARVPVLLTHRRLLERLPKTTAKVVCLDTDGAVIEQESDEPLTRDVASDQLAYAIYTSGSTGKPRGVQITHQALSNFTLWAGNTYDLRPGDRVLQFASVSFDAAIEEVFPTLSRGAALILRTDEMLGSVRTFLELCGEWQVTVLDLPTGYWHALARNISEGLCFPEAVRLVIIGGEKASAERLAEWKKSIGARSRLVNTYGPTEATVVSTACDLTLDIESDGTSEVPIGRPISNVRTYVLDKHLNPVPIGFAGELHIAGSGLASGYLNRRDLTAEKFIEHRFSNGRLERLFRTGDTVRYRSDGILEFLGRSDHQVKVMGYRVELGEIESLLAEYPGVSEAIVKLQETRSKGTCLVAYITAKAGARPTAAELRAYVYRKLPVYMVPPVIILKEYFPLTASGKIDRDALLPPAAIGSTREDGSAAARTPIEKAVADIWLQVLGIENVNIHENFFELGGHSLLATQVISRIREAFQVELPLRSLFETPTISGLASQIHLALQRAQNGAERPPIVPVNRDQALPLSFSQSRMWFMNRLAPESPAYNIAAALRFQGRLDYEALQKSLDEIVARHESIRTIFPAVDGQPTQVIQEPSTVPIRRVKLADIPHDRLEQARSLVTEDARRPFNLEQDLLMRALVIEVEEDDHVLLLTMHHIASDQWSLGILSRELTQLYNSFCKGVRPQLSSLPLQYADFAVWQREWSKTELLRRQLSYWKEKLAGIEPVTLPADRPRSQLQSFRGAYVRADVSPSLVEALKSISAQEKATLYMTLLAAFKALLFRYTGQTDLAIGSPIANRNWMALEGIVGTFVNTLVLRTDLTGDPSFRELLRRVREVTIEAYANQEAPFEKIVEELQPERDNSRSPLIQVLFNFQNAPFGDANLQDVSWSPFEFDIGASQFDFCLGVDPDILGSIVLSYDTDLFDRDRMVRMLGHFIRLLEDILTDPEKRISKLEILTQAEKHQLIELWNSRQLDFPREARVQDLYETQVEHRPDALAVIWREEKLSYRELNARANRLARYLRGLGVRRGDLVGIFMERSTDIVTAMLGTWKSGAAYVPLDPDYPEKRICVMLEDSQASFVLTQERLQSRLPPIPTTVVCVDKDWTSIANESEENPACGGKADDLAYVIYTSGSTGGPKGVAITHRALVNCLVSMASEPGFSADDVMLSLTSISFDIAGLEIFLPLITGGRAVLVPREVAADGMLLKNEIDSSDATVMQATPTTWRLLLDAGWKGAQALKILCGGEALSTDLASALLQRSPSVWNLYGPTETTIWSTICRVRPDAPITIGRPIGNTQVYILDSNLEPVPIGIVGEIYIAGAGVARGYWQNPELTQQKFIRVPSVVLSRGAGEESGDGASSETRAFKTGDLGHYLLDGNIEYLGRTDHQIKLRGHRIEPGEIESVLAEHAMVKYCVVDVKSDGNGGKRLVAYVVPSTDEINTVELRQHLKQRLPNYMLPSHFSILRSLPLTPNGKIDRAALAATPDFSVSETEKSFIPPRNPVERRLAMLWKKVLRVQRVGIKDNFFDLGGHSLLAVRLMSQIEKSFGRKFPIAVLFQAPTVEEMAELIEQNRSCSHKAVRRLSGFRRGQSSADQV